MYPAPTPGSGDPYYELCSRCLTVTNGVSYTTPATVTRTVSGTSPISISLYCTNDSTYYYTLTQLMINGLIRQTSTNPYTNWFTKTVSITQTTGTYTTVVNEHASPYTAGIVTAPENSRLSIQYRFKRTNRSSGETNNYVGHIYLNFGKITETQARLFSNYFNYKMDISYRQIQTSGQSVNLAINNIYLVSAPTSITPTFDMIWPPIAIRSDCERWNPSSVYTITIPNKALLATGSTCSEYCHREAHGGIMDSIRFKIINNPSQTYVSNQAIRFSDLSGEYEISLTEDY